MAPTTPHPRRSVIDAPRRITGPRRATAAVLTLLLVSVVGLTACGLGQPAPQPTGQPPNKGGPAETGEVAWRPCPELLDELLGEVVPSALINQLGERMTYECGTLAVPQDWDAPAAPERYELALVRARATGQRDRIGSLLVNPGGPGGSGVEAAVALSLGPIFGGLSSRVTDRFDLVGFDPRGVGDSHPIECFSDDQLDESFGADPDPVARAEFDALVSASRGQLAACEAKYGESLRHFSTRQTAHDLEALRAAVGDERLTFVGFSYGSLLGAVYAHLYPDRVRAMVLDGAVNPELDVVASSEQQAAGFERALDNFSAWCDTASGCALAPTARAAIDDALAQARRSAPVGADGREATAGWVFWAVVSALYSQQAWPQLADALAAFHRGDPGGVFQLADAYARRADDGSYSNLFDANTVITCMDYPTDVEVGQVRDLQQQWRQAYPMFGGAVAMSVLDCALWQPAPDPFPMGPAAGAPPIVVVGTTGDPATPYESTTELAEAIGVGVVVTVDGEGHTSYPEHGCVAELVDAYLVDLTVPPEGARCS